MHASSSSYSLLIRRSNHSCCPYSYPYSSSSNWQQCIRRILCWVGWYSYWDRCATAAEEKDTRIAHLTSPGGRFFCEILCVPYLPQLSFWYLVLFQNKAGTAASNAKTLPLLTTIILPLPLITLQLCASLLPPSPLIQIQYISGGVCHNSSGDGGGRTACPARTCCTPLINPSWFNIY